jgi:hypothetical protein
MEKSRQYQKNIKMVTINSHVSRGAHSPHCTGCIEREDFYARRYSQNNPKEWEMQRIKFEQQLANELIKESRYDLYAKKAQHRVSEYRRKDNLSDNSRTRSPIQQNNVRDSSLSNKSLKSGFQLRHEYGYGMGSRLEDMDSSLKSLQKFGGETIILNDTIKSRNASMLPSNSVPVISPNASNIAVALTRPISRHDKLPPLKDTLQVQGKLIPEMKSTLKANVGLRGIQAFKKEYTKPGKQYPFNVMIPPEQRAQCQDIMEKLRKLDKAKKNLVVPHGIESQNPPETKFRRDRR